MSEKLIKSGELIGFQFFLFFLYVSRMMHQYLLSQMGGVDVCVDLGGGNGLMPQHGLDGTEAGTTFKEGSSEGVSEHVGRDGLLNASLLYEVFYHQEYHDACERLLAPMTHKHIVLIFWGYGKQVTVKKIETEFTDGFV